ncbi:hypothetical protein [Thalassotalea sp. ND16A]|uniref:hypothetical protein n=1 Tax=Thalassotalea sp. ND16A TaxID=1535422 RepID=UPI00051CF28E|nr:hypothetical protein [Thalassotalea sp. ND16A]KGJ93394.1 hypothetical protein ND16A_1507 [Thalassotalea sp. ND16A]
MLDGYQINAGRGNKRLINNRISRNLITAGEAQVQRAGGEGFSHNEVNPDNTKNRMLQLWVLPDESEQTAGYKHYPLKTTGVTRIYGGNKSQSKTFDSNTTIDILRLPAGENIKFDDEVLAYVSQGNAKFADENSTFNAEQGDLIRSYKTELSTNSDVEIVEVIVIFYFLFVC